MTVVHAVMVAVCSLGVSKRIDGSECDSQQKRNKYGNDRHKQLASDAVACDIITRHYHAFECTPKRAHTTIYNANVFQFSPFAATALALLATAESVQRRERMRVEEIRGVMTHRAHPFSQFLAANRRWFAFCAGCAGTCEASEK